jgi:peptide/nickel transport system substrate-binding protein
VPVIRTLLGRSRSMLSKFRRQPAPTTPPPELDRQLVASLNRKKLPGLRQFRYISKMLSPQEWRRVKLFGVILLGSGILLLGTYYAFNFTRVPAFGGEYTEGLIGAPRLINPLLAQTNDVDMDLSRLIFAGLVRYDQNLHIIPELAEHWTISEDKKTYTFVLKPNLTWHDGEMLTADDVVFTIQSILDPDFKSPLLISFRGVTAKKVDAQTITFTLPEPYPEFLDALTVGILPEHIWGNIEPINANLNEYNLRPVGAGAWQFAALTKDRLGNVKSVTLTPFADWTGDKPYIEHLIFKFYPDFETAATALTNHSVDGMSFLPKHLKATIAPQRHLTLYSFPVPQFTAVFFNEKQNDVFKDKNVRTALAQAIDRDQIVTDALQLEGKRINGPLLPEVAPALDEKYTLNYDAAKAAELLDEAGWKSITPEQYQAAQNPTVATTTETDGAETEPVPSEPVTTPPADDPGLSSYRQKDGKILEITLTTVNQPESVAVARLIQEHWQHIGVLTHLEITEVSRIAREVIKPRNYQALLFGEIVGPDADPYPFWHSSQNQDPGLNLAVFSNRQVDTLLENARSAKTDEEKAKAYDEFQTIIANDVPAIFLYVPTYTYVAASAVKGVGVDRVLLPADRFNNIQHWYIKTRHVFTGSR